MSRIGASRTLASVVLLFLPALLAAPVHAQPDDGGQPPAAASTTLGWAALGMEREVILGPDSPRTFTVPVPEGLTPSRLRGTIRAPLNIGAGYLMVDDADGRLLGTVDLPPAGAAQAAVPVDVDISAARARDSSADLTITVHPLAGAGQYSGQYPGQFCGPLQQLTLADLATVYTGAEPPVTTIAGFFPPVLSRATIYAPTDADAAEQQAVLLLVSTLARLYNPQPLVIEVVDQPRGAVPPPGAPLSRAVVVERGGPAGLSVENPGGPGVYLRVSGSGDDLSTQVSLLVNDLQTLAQTPAARVEQAGTEEAVSGDTLTFEQLNISGKTEVLRASSLQVGIGRSALGGSRFDSVQVHLLADYTPVPAGDAGAVMIRSSDGNVVYRSALDSSGRLDATFDMPNQKNQSVSLELALTYVPQQMCGPLTAPMTFQIDPRSTFTVHRGGPPLGGFSAFPSEFSPSFVVAMDGSSPNQLSYAARVVAAIASLTDRPLMPTVVDMKEALDGNTGALIVAKSSALRQSTLHPPVSGDGPALDVNLPEALQAIIGDGLGSIQAFADRPRNRSVVLVTTTGEWPMVDPLLEYIDGLEGKWSALSGDVLAAGEAGVPINLSIFAQGGDTAEAVEQPDTEQTSPPWRTIGIAAAVLIVIAVVAAILWASRRRRSGAAVRTTDDAAPPGPPA
jgi:hypothetical protein